MTLRFSVSTVRISLLTMFICSCGHGKKGLGGDLSMFAHTHTQIGTSKRVPGIVTFHISFKSMRDYSPPFRKEERKKTLMESISFKHLKDHLR